MRERFPFLDNPIVQFILRTLLVAVTTVLIFITIYFSSSKDLIDACNASFISGAVAIGIGLFSLMNRYGGFDFFEYGFVQVISSMRKGSPRPYIDLIDYKEQKKSKRKTDGLFYISYLIVGVVWIIVASILLAKLNWVLFFKKQKIIYSSFFKKLFAFILNYINKILKFQRNNYMYLEYSNK